jgi:DNA-binding NtrC family response regulator
LAAGARTALLGYSWPGNVRELANLMERVALLSGAPQVTAEALDFARNPVAQPREAVAAVQTPGLRGVLEGVERACVLEALGQAHWNITRAAARLGISRDPLRYRIVRHRLRPGGDEGSPAHAGRSPTRARASLDGLR